MTLSWAFSARKPTARCVPSHIGLCDEWPHRQSAIATFPSTITRFGPFSLDTISTFGMPLTRKISGGITPRWPENPLVARSPPRAGARHGGCRRSPRRGASFGEFSVPGQALIVAFETEPPVPGQHLPPGGPALIHGSVATTRARVKQRRHASWTEGSPIQPFLPTGARSNGWPRGYRPPFVAPRDGRTALDGRFPSGMS